MVMRSGTRANMGSVAAGGIDGQGLDSGVGPSKRADELD